MHNPFRYFNSSPEVIRLAGHAEGVSVRRSSGYRLLDEVAVKAVQKWRFIPAHSAGKPVSGWVDVSIAFKLTN